MSGSFKIVLQLVSIYWNENFLYCVHAIESCFVHISPSCSLHSGLWFTFGSHTVNILFFTSELTEHPASQVSSHGVKLELIMLSLPAIAGQAIDPLAQLMETAYIGRLGTSFFYLTSYASRAVMVYFSDLELPPVCLAMV